MSTIDIGNLYDMNKTAISKEKTLDYFEIKYLLNKVKMFFSNKKDKYFTLLCREKYDFTVFRLREKSNSTLEQTLKDLQECLENRGKVTSIEITPDNNAIEIWIKIDNEPFVYYLFPYDEGIIEE